ncbi:MAG: WecB/TagA/CpsF family glycosyltransferase [Actinomycetota bacterium]
MFRPCPSWSRPPADPWLEARTLPVPDKEPPIESLDDVSTPQSFTCCGVRIHALGPAQAAAAVLDRVGRPSAVHLCNAYTLSLALRDADYRRIVDAGDLNFADGFPVAAVGRRRGHPSMTRRVYGPDLFLDVLREGVGRRTRHYLYGSTQAVLDLMKERLPRLVPGVQIVGAEAPPFRPLTPAEQAAVGERVRDAAADIVWVGLGTPKQDSFVADMRDALGVPLVAVGAAFDFVAETKPMAPAWMQRTGLEWLFRLATEPRRLWKRYLVGNTVFLWGVLSDELRLRRRP